MSFIKSIDWCFPVPNSNYVCDSINHYLLYINFNRSMDFFYCHRINTFDVTNCKAFRLLPTTKHCEIDWFFKKKSPLCVECIHCYLKECFTQWLMDLLKCFKANFIVKFIIHIFSLKLCFYFIPTKQLWHGQRYLTFKTFSKSHANLCRYFHFQNDIINF